MRTFRILLTAAVLSAAGLNPDVAAGGARIDLPDGRSLDVFFAFQFWNATTFAAVNSLGQDLETRSDSYIRRGRVGIKGLAHRKVSYRIWFAYDNVGKDPHTSASGASSLNNREFYLWDAFCTIHADPTWLNLTLGYFRPQLGRESITTAFAVDSFTKALANGYLRQHVVGRSSGRETGINVGGLYHPGGWGVNYNFGLFDTNHESITGSSVQGIVWAPLWTGRIAMSLGDAEMDRYGLGYRVNTFGRRRGITVAVNGSYQGQTNESVLLDFPSLAGSYNGGFRSNAMIGWDLLFNHGPFNLTAEYDILRRTFGGSLLALLPDLAPEYTERVWHVRTGYNVTVGNEHVIEPVIMLSRFEADRHSASYIGGEHELVSAGVNWYLNGDSWKINLHYTWQDLTLRPRYSSDRSDKGDFLGLGFQIVF